MKESNGEIAGTAEAEKSRREFGRLIGKISRGGRMSREESCEAYRQVILNEQPELQQGAFLAAHFASGPSIEELAGAWDAMDRYDTSKISCEGKGVVCDIVGTGSDSLKTMNCSSPAAIIAAAAGLRVAKKGARLVTGVSGATDIFERWGLDVAAPLEKAGEALRKCGLCYLPGESFLRSGWARLIKSMRFTSVFNIIGPITKPCAQTSRIIIGAYSPSVCDQLIAILREIGMDAALSSYGMVDGKEATWGMDEFSPCGATRVVELAAGRTDVYELTPSDFGCRVHPFEAIASRSTAGENAAAIMEVLKGRRPEGPLADFFCMNAGAMLRLSGLSEDYKAGTAKAREVLASGKALEKLKKLLSVQGSATVDGLAGS